MQSLNLTIGNQMMNTQKRIRILVVDDAPTIRELLTDSLGSQPDFEIVAVASNGEQALEMLEKCAPDVITLDLEMPRMNGLETLDHILERRPTPVIVVSSLAQRNAEVTLQALDRGAMDYVAKPEGLADAAKVFLEELPSKIRNMAGADVARILQLRKARHLRQKVAERAQQITTAPDFAKMSRACIVIGVSTGGPPRLSFSFLSPRAATSTDRGRATHAAAFYGAFCQAARLSVRAGNQGSSRRR